MAAKVAGRRRSKGARQGGLQAQSARLGHEHVLHDELAVRHDNGDGAEQRLEALGELGAAWRRAGSGRAWRASGLALCSCQAGGRAVHSAGAGACAREAWCVHSTAERSVAQPIFVPSQAPHRCSRGSSVRRDGGACSGHKFSLVRYVRAGVVTNAAASAVAWQPANCKQAHRDEGTGALLQGHLHAVSGDKRPRRHRGVARAGLVDVLQAAAGGLVCVWWGVWRSVCRQAAARGVDAM